MAVLQLGQTEAVDDLHFDEERESGAHLVEAQAAERGFLSQQMAQGWRAPNVRRVRGVTFHVAAGKSTRRAIFISVSAAEDIVALFSFFFKSCRQKVLSAQLPLLPPHFQRLQTGSSANEINVRDAGNAPSGVPGDGTRYFSSLRRCVFINLEISQNKNFANRKQALPEHQCEKNKTKNKKLSCKMHEVSFLRVF